MNIILSNSSDQPIYEQIVEQMKTMIINNELEVGEALPSIRGLAKDLRISVITTKRAYEELEREKFIETIPGKGSYVALKSKQLHQEEILKKIEQELQKAIHLANRYHLSQKELFDLFSYLYEEETK